MSESIFGVDNIGDASSEVFIDDNDFTASDEMVIDEQVDGFVGGFEEFDDGAFAEAEDILDLDIGSAKFDGDTDEGIEEEVRINFLFMGEIFDVDIFSIGEFLVSGRVIFFQFSLFICGVKILNIFFILTGIIGYNLRILEEGF